MALSYVNFGQSEIDTKTCCQWKERHVAKCMSLSKPELIRPISRLKITKKSKNEFLAKAPGVNRLNTSGIHQLHFRYFSP